MYEKEQLSRYPFFAGILEYGDVSTLLDPLTGLVSRPYIIEFTKRLIREKTPFTFAMLNLDNFKFINDTYGHEMGNDVLAYIGKDLIRFLGDKGLAARYGGDEFIIINFEDITYDDKKSFFEQMYANYHVKDNVLRKTIHLSYCEPFITGTTGCASFPVDAQDYNSLFGLIDKTLYRGKSKGRNCYIIYLEEKHKDIEIKKITDRGLYTCFHNISEQFDLVEDMREKLQLIFTSIRDRLAVEDLYYIGKNRILKSLKDPSLAEPVPGIDTLVQGDIFPTNYLEDIKAACPSLYRILTEMGMGSALLARSIAQKEVYGYVMCCVPEETRNWSDEDFATLFYIAREIACCVSTTDTVFD